ncbi:piggyBac transposable element-derived protein 4-like [Rana temporaria]|uniref:piggyBac transposable element-derived protein 4-like n=1 Tax=Rana temporaria TaxID=8407 RepID=UPI001AAD72FF|nr:piggyBac transposable element-derived protein 4-like [Rana temporaria]
MASRRYTAEQAYALLCSDSEPELGSEDENFICDSESDTSGSSSDHERPVTSRQQEDVKGSPPSVAQPLYTSQWIPASSFTPQIPTFTASPGININVENFGPVDFFKIFVDDELLQHMVDQTNLNVTQFIAKHPTSSHRKRWVPTHLTEMKIVLDLLLNMGLVRKPKIRQYWASSPIHATLAFPAVMSRDRFEALLRFMHFNDNLQCPPSSDATYDRLFKLRPLISFRSKKFAAVYTPDKNISIYESLMNFKGRLHFRQFIPSKRARCGIKFYKLCESTTGNTYGFLIYEGRDRHINPLGCPDNLGVSGKIVWQLIQPLLHQGYNLYVDNYYSSVTLFRSLHAAGTGACGTVRKNRKEFPQQLVRQRLQRGTSLSYQQEEMMAVKFSDRKEVYMLTAIHPEGTVTVTERGSATPKEKPLCITAYNKYMGGVDLSDQILQPYLVMRKSKTWYKKVAIYLIQVAIHNSFVLYKKSGGTDTFLQYQEKIIEHLMFQEDPRQPAESEDVRRLTERHFLRPIPITASCKFPRKKCRVCGKNGKRCDTRYHCPTCPSNPGLCLDPCFEIYHTIPHY